MPGGASPSQASPTLMRAWKLDENWGTNIVALAGPLAALFGTTVTKPFLGEDAESLVALVTVGAAISTFTVLLAPIVLVAFKSHRWDGERRTSSTTLTVGGVLLAGVLVLTSAYGAPLGRLFKTARQIRPQRPCSTGTTWGSSALVALLFLVYAFRSTKFMLEGGTETPVSDGLDHDPGDA